MAAGALSASELPLVVRMATEAAATPRLLAVPPAICGATGALRSQVHTTAALQSARALKDWKACHHLGYTACSIMAAACGGRQVNSTSGPSVLRPHHLAATAASWDWVSREFLSS